MNTTETTDASGFVDDTEPVTVQVNSTGLVNAPGFMAWIRRVHADDPVQGLAVLADAVPSMPVGAALAYLQGDAETWTEPGDAGPTLCIRVK